SARMVGVTLSAWSQRENDSTSSPTIPCTAHTSARRAATCAVAFVCKSFSLPAPMMSARHRSSTPRCARAASTARELSDGTPRAMHIVSCAGLARLVGFNDGEVDVVQELVDLFE